MQTTYFSYYLELAKSHSFSEAAQLLNISQSGLSRAILSIEQEIGCDLFLRRGNSIYLTKEGERFADYASQIVEILKKINALKNLDKTDYLHHDTNCKKLYCDATSTSFAVLAALYKRRSVNLQDFHYSELSPDLILQKALLQKKDDPWLFLVSIPVGGSFERKLRHIRNITFTPLLEIQAMAKVPLSSSLSDKQRLSPYDLSQVKWAVSNDCNINDILKAATGKTYINKYVYFRSIRRDKVDQVILENDCIGLTNNYSQKTLSSRFVAVPFQKDAISLVGLLSRTDLYASQETESFCRNIAKTCNKIKLLPW